MKLKVLSVSEVNRYIKKYISGNPILSHIEIEGELSNFKRHSSGHLYFTLKDQTSKMACVMFKSDTGAIPDKLKDGMKLVASGQINVYERDGRYQLYVKKIRVAGIGDLHVKFEAMKEQLMEEGLFDHDVKQEIPVFPNKIAVITSPTGAAVRDILTVTKRRNPLVDVVIYPVRVQGETSKNEIIAALKSVEENDSVDTIILGRGGGSIEELWSFNEESVARAISACPLPVISAVGHETDFTIADFVADMRAATPSAGAELAVADLNQYRLDLQNLIEQSEYRVLDYIQRSKQSVMALQPKQLLINTENKLNDYYQQLDSMVDNMQHMMDKYFLEQTSELEKLLLTLEMHSPIHSLKRGYALLENSRHNVIMSTKEVEKDDVISVKMSDGTLETKVLTVNTDGGV
jgi:exodeoxyribonuclease VII large subunit